MKIKCLTFLQLGETGSKLVLEQVTTTIAAVADSAEKQFTVFYDRFMPTLKMIMQVIKCIYKVVETIHCTSKVLKLYLKGYLACYT